MNIKGFTLMELLAVIVILALLALVANSSVTNVVKNSKSDLYTAQLELIKTTAETWGSDNLDKIPEDGKCSYLTLEDLREYGLFEEEVINPKTNKEFDGDLKIKLSSKITESGLLKTTYEVDPQSIKDCSDVYPPMCTLQEGYTANTLGAKYSCDFGGEARNFYILELGTKPITNSTLKSDEVALILEVNYDITTQTWCDQEGTNPNNNVCAADGLTSKLDEIASAWIKLDRKQIVIPSAVQVVVADGQSSEAYLNQPALSNAWLYNKNPDNSDLGYWTSTGAKNSSAAWYVDYNGYVSGTSIYIDYCGVRPVVNLSIEELG